MCGRFALGVVRILWQIPKRSFSLLTAKNLNDLPNQFTSTALLVDKETHESADTHGSSNEGFYQFDIHGSEGDMTRVELDATRVQDWYPSYNIAPTNSALIVYKVQSQDSGINQKYVLEPSKFGLLPSWARPKDPTPVNKGTPNEGPQYSREIQRYQGKYFNCRRESLQEHQPQWNASRKHRCVVPIQGYFEWLKTKGDKIPYYVHSKKSALIYTAGFYSHNSNYENYRNNSDYLSSFTIITAPALKTDTHDISWLHDRKPVFLAPGSKEWDDWLDPSKNWEDSMIETCLNSAANKAYADIEGYPVSKKVGVPSNNGEDVIERVESKPQASISSFFQPQKKQPELKVEPTDEQIKQEDDNSKNDDVDVKEEENLDGLDAPEINEGESEEEEPVKQETEQDEKVEEDAVDKEEGEGDAAKGDPEAKHEVEQEVKADEEGLEEEAGEKDDDAVADDEEVEDDDEVVEGDEEENYQEGEEEEEGEEDQDSSYTSGSSNSRTKGRGSKRTTNDEEPPSKRLRNKEDITNVSIQEIAS